jgi:hypothetical protein
MPASILGELLCEFVGEVFAEGFVQYGSYVAGRITVPIVTLGSVRCRGWNEEVEDEDVTPDFWGHRDESDQLILSPEATELVGAGTVIVVTVVTVVVCNVV